MKKIVKSASLFVAAVYLPHVCFAAQTVAAYQGTQSSFQETRSVSSGESADAEKLSQELSRNRELLEIWKDHVRTLTKERDEALKEIESLKGGYTDAEKEQYLKTIEDLKGQIGTLRSENQRVKSEAAAPKVQPADADFIAKFGQLQEENERLKLSMRELQESKTDKEVLIREKQQALQRSEDLEKQLSNLRAENQQLRSAAATASVSAVDAGQDQKIQVMQDAYDELEKNFKEQQDKVRRLQAEKLEDKTKVQELKTQILKLQSGSDSQGAAQAEELQETKAALEASDIEKQKALSQLRDLKEQKEGLSSQVEGLKAQIASLQSGSDSQLSARSAELVKAKSEAETLRAEKDRALAQVESLNARIAELESRSAQSAATIGSELTSLKTERDQLKKNYTQIDANYRTQGERMKAIQAEAAESKKQNESLRQETQRLATELELLKAEKGQFAALKTDLDKLQADHQAQGGRIKALESEKTQIQNTLQAERQSYAEKSKALSAEKDVLNDRIQELQFKVKAFEAQGQEIQNLQQKLDSTLVGRQTLEKEASALEAENQGLNAKIQSLKSDMEQLALENQKAEGLRTQLDQVIAEKEALKKSFAGLQASMLTNERSLKEYTAKLAELDRSNIQLRSENKRIVQENQALQGSLKANLTDIQNLKSNFESYLESLEQSFGDRQPKEGA